MKELVRKEMVKRGYIYKWHEGLSDERFVLVVSADNRGNEKLINVLMFGNSWMGRDVIEINNKLLGETRYLHCGTVTYVNRNDMSEHSIAQVSEGKMLKVDKLLSVALGITKDDVLAELNFYKRKCDDLIEKITGTKIEL